MIELSEIEVIVVPETVKSHAGLEALAGEVSSPPHDDHAGLEALAGETTPDWRL